MLVPRIYVDTSVIGGYFDPEFAEKTARLFDAFARGKARMVLSDLTLRELEPAPEHVRNLADELAMQYIAVGAVREVTGS